MELAAVGLAFLTVLLGTTVLADLSPKLAGPRSHVSVHVLLALVATGLTGAAAAVGGAPLGFVAVAGIAVAGGFGVLVLRRSQVAVTGVVIVHGVAAGLTLVLALLAAARTL